MDGQYKDIHKVKLTEIHQEDEQSYKLHCPSCETVVPAKNMNIVDKIAKCDACDSLFPIDAKETQKKKATEQIVVEQPSNIEVTHNGLSKEMFIRDKKGVKGFMFFSYFLSIATLGLLFLSLNEFTIAINVIFWSFTLWYTYLYRDFTQKIFLEFGDEILSMEYVPWFFTRRREVYISTIRKVIIRNLGDIYGKGHSLYQVHLKIDKGDGIEHYKLMPWSYHTKEEADYIKQELDQHLHLSS